MSHTDSHDKLTEEQERLLMEIKELFDPADAADSSILYECTRFKSEIQEDTFWEYYDDFVALGDTELTREDKDESILAKVKK